MDLIAKSPLDELIHHTETFIYSITHTHYTRYSTYSILENIGNYMEGDTNNGNKYNI